MKNLISIIVLLLLLSCGTSRKTQKEESKVNVDSVVEQSADMYRFERVVDTTRTDKGKVTITEIIFYVPDSMPKKSPPEANAELPNVGNFSGVKLVRQTVVESVVKQSGQSRETQEQTQSKSNANVSREEQSKAIEATPMPDPYKWRYIFYILAVGVGVLLYLKRVPVLNWIKKILAGIRRIF